MRKVFVHTAALEMEQDADVAAPGAAITARLCGSWDHPGPCPLAPHHTDVCATGRNLIVRVLFATDLDQEPRVRRLIFDALSAGHLTDHRGRASSWRLTEHEPATLRREEKGLAARLVSSE